MKNRTAGFAALLALAAAPGAAQESAKIGFVGTFSGPAAAIGNDMLMGAVCPKEVYPPAEALQFCTTAYAGGYDSRATLAFIKETAKDPVRIGFAAMSPTRQ